MGRNKQLNKLRKAGIDMENVVFLPKGFQLFVPDHQVAEHQRVTNNQGRQMKGHHDNTMLEKNRMRNIIKKRVAQEIKARQSYALVIQQVTVCRAL